MGRTRQALVALALAASLGACGSDEPRSPADPTTAEPTETQTGEAQTGETETGDATATPEPSDDATQGSPDSPAVLDAELKPLDWQQVLGPTSTTVTVSGEWTLTQRATEAVLDGPRSIIVDPPRRHRVTDALIDGEYAVVVTEDEQARQPNTATVIDLASGKRTILDGSSEVPTTSGGTWALGAGKLVHATIGPGRAYCLATVDLATMTSGTGWCAPPRNGFSGARVTPGGTTLLAFDDQRPSCRTVGSVDGDELVPFEGVPECLGWDASLLDGGAVWSVVPKAKRVEEAHFYARSEDGWFDLGPGTSGSLTWCGGSAYFVRDPQRSEDPAELLSWSPDAGLLVAYETADGGQAFLTAPRCGGDDVTLTALAESGDTQISATAR